MGLNLFNHGEVVIHARVRLGRDMATSASSMFLFKNKTINSSVHHIGLGWTGETHVRSLQGKFPHSWANSIPVLRGKKEKKKKETQTRMESIFKLYLQLSQWQKVVWKKKMLVSPWASKQNRQKSQEVHLTTGNVTEVLGFFFNTIN